MKLQISESVNSNDWDKKICSIGGPIFHSSTWAKYIVAGAPHVVPQFMSLISDDGEFLGAALGFEHGSRHKLIRYFNKFLWFDAIPVVRDNDEKTLCEFLQMIDCHAQRSGYVELSIGSFASRDVSVEMERLGYSLTKRFEFELHLDRSEDYLWKGIGVKQRNSVRKALKAGVTVEELPPERGIPELHRLQAESARRILERGGPDIAFKQQNLQDPLGLLVASGLGRIVGADLGGDLVSAVLFTFFNGLVYLHLAGHDLKGMRAQAPTLLQWHSIRKYRNEGAKRFSLGGCSASAVDDDSPEHGVYNYKKSLGFERLQCATGTKILRRNRHRALNLAKIVLRR